MNLSKFFLSSSVLLWLFGCQSAQDLSEEAPAIIESHEKHLSKVSEHSPVKVYILSGQSNMVGMGDIAGGSTRWGKEFSDVSVSLFSGNYDPKKNYDTMSPEVSKELTAFGGTKPTPYPTLNSHYTAITRGFITMKSDGVYRFNVGYGASTYAIMTVNGQEVYRKEEGSDPVRADFSFKGGKKIPFKITYLNRSANGLGWLYRTDVPGTMTTLVNQGKFEHLRGKDGNWASRDDVIYKGVISATGQGPLKVGIQRGGTIGPELGFGWILGDFHDEPVLLIKASIGNRSLGWDILPPGSDRYEFGGYIHAGYKDSPSRWKKGEDPQPINWYAGKTYDRYVENIHKVLNDFDLLFPQFKDRGYEVSGFVWWQGHKDGNDAHAQHYEKNLVRLIKSWRKEFNALDAPWVIATIGFGGWKLKGPHLKVAEAQLSVSGETGHYKEFIDNVLTVETRDFWREADESPKNQDYHYNRNAETYYLVGEALGKGMVSLKKKQ